MRVIQILVVSFFCVGTQAQQIARMTFPSGYGFAAVPNVGSIQFISDQQPTAYLSSLDGSSVILGFLLPVFNSVSTASHNIHPDHRILVYPNPFQQTIQIENKSFGPYAFQLMDMQGHRLESGKTADASHRINARYLASGMYVLRITGVDGNFELYKMTKIN